MLHFIVRIRARRIFDGKRNDHLGLSLCLILMKKKKKNNKKKK